MNPTITTNNLDEMVRALERIGTDVAIKETRGMARLGGNIIRKRAREVLAANAARDTGRLQKGLFVRVRFFRRKGEIVATIGTKREAFYGMFLEFGTEKVAGIRWLTRGAMGSVQSLPNRLADHLRKRLPVVVRRHKP